MAGSTYPTPNTMTGSGATTQTRISSIPPKSDPKAVAAHVKSLISQARTLRRAEETDWYIDIRFLAGDQWLSWDPRRSVLFTKPKKKWRIRQTINHMRPDMEILVDILTSQTGVPRAKPATSDPERSEGARAAVKHFRHEWHRQDMDDLADDLALYTLTTSMGVLKIGWNPDSGEVVQMPDWDLVPEGELPPEGLPTNPVSVGELTSEIVPTFNFFADPSARSERPNVCRWMADVTYMHVEDARQRWGSKHGIQADSRSDAWFDYAKRLQYKDAGRQMSDDIQDTVSVLTWYARPAHDRPTGRKVVVVGDTVVEDIASPWGGMFPYAIFRCYKNVGSFYGQSACNLARTVQKAINNQRSLTMEHFVKGGHSQWLAIKGSGLKRSDFTDEPGNVLFANPIGQDPVKPLHPAAMAPGWSELLNKDLQDFHSLTGAADVLRGVNPPGVRAGRTFAYAVEQVMGRHRPLVKRTARGWTQVARLWLHGAKNFIAEDRMLQIVGDTGGIEVYHMRHQDLKDAQDIFIDAATAMPESQNAREDRVGGLYEMGLIVDETGQPSPAKALKLMRVETAADDDLYEQDSASRAWAVEENERMAQGEDLMPEAHDNHPKHAELHVAFMRTSRYRKLPDRSRAIFRQHLDATIEIMQGDPRQAPEGPPGQLPAGGGGGGGGGPSLGGGPSEDMRGGPSPIPEPRSDMRGGPD